MPHSVPARTSLASSLKRRSDSSAPSKITTLSRSTRIGLLRLTVPSVTRQPATTPNLLERNTSRTCAMPTICSLISGASRPLISCLNVVDGFVDDAVVADFDAGLLDRLARARVGAHVEADDARAGGGRQLHVGFGDAADIRSQHLDLHLVGGQLVERVAQRLGAALHVGLDDHGNDAGLGVLDLREHVLGRACPGAAMTLVSRCRLCRCSATSRALLSLSSTSRSSPALGAAVRPSTTTGMDGARRFHRLAMSRRTWRARDRTAMPARIGSPTFSVPRLTSTVATAPRPFSMLDSTTMPEARPPRGALSSSTSACSRMASSSLSMPVPSFAETCTNMVEPPHSSEITSYLDSSVRTRSASASGLSILLTATTIGTPAALACCTASMVCGMTPSSAATTSTTTSVALRAARAHGGERRVARGIQERDHAARRLDVVRADVLRDAAGLAGRDLGAPDVVQQRGLAVVDVTHDRDHRRTRQLYLGVAVDALQVLLDLVFLDQPRLVTHLLDHQHGGVLVDGLVDGGHHAQAHQGLDDFVGLDGHAVGQLGDGDGLADRHFALLRRGGHLEAVLLLAIGRRRPAAHADLLLLEARADVAGDVQFLASVARGRGRRRGRRLLGRLRRGVRPLRRAPASRPRRLGCARAALHARRLRARRCFALALFLRATRLFQRLAAVLLFLEAAAVFLVQALAPRAARPRPSRPPPAAPPRLRCSSGPPCSCCARFCSSSTSRFT